MTLIDEADSEFYNKLIMNRGTPPTKSEHDKKEYSVIKLKNGLKALIISDVENILDNTENDLNNKIEDKTNVDENNGQKNKLAACSLTVGGAGSFNDFEKIPGLAHFVEHMIFLGSNRYPKENDFSSFINKTGGYFNAMTDSECVTFSFDCAEKYLEEALKRFSSLFESPLMKQESMKREREAVDSEFQLLFTSDFCRAEEIFKTTATPQNPARKFNWGNSKTLQENISDDDLYKAIHKFWEKYYLANRTTVAIQARLPMKTLEKFIADCFSGIKFNYKTISELPRDNLFNMELFNKIYIIEPIQNTTELQMTWVLPPVNYKTKIMSYIGFLMEYEGKGSLKSYLQKKLWSLNLSADCGDRGIENNSMYSTFKLTINLTTEGLKNYKNVIKLIFSYIKLLQDTGPVEWIFKEIQTIRRVQFQFSEEMKSLHYVDNLSKKMQRLPSKDYLTGGQLVYYYNRDDIMNTLNALTPNSVNVMLLSKKIAEEEQIDKTEPWFNTKYKIKIIEEELLKEWKSVEIEPSLQLPKPNLYLTTDFDVLPTMGDEDNPPEQMMGNDSIEAWYKLVTKFKSPVGYIRFYLISPIATNTAKNSAMMDLLLSIFVYNIQEEAYPATVASLSITVYPFYSGIIIEVGGFNEKLHVLTNKILNRLKNFKNDTTEELFITVKEDLWKRYITFCKDPDNLQNELQMKLLQNPFWMSIDKLQAYEGIAFQDLLDYKDQFFKNMYVKCLIQGNISKKEANSIINDFLNTINYKPIKPGMFPEIETMEVPKSENYLRVIPPESKNNNCNVTNIYQTTIGGHVEEKSKIELLMLMMSDPLIYKLRTQEQLAYNVGCSSLERFDILGWMIYVKPQANKHSVEYVEERITEFLKYFQTRLKNITTDEFDKYKNALITSKRADTETYNEVARNWGEITNNKCDFNKQAKEIECIQTLKTDDIYNHFKKTLSLDGNELCLRKLSVQVDSNVPNENDSSTEVNNTETTHNGEENDRESMHKPKQPSDVEHEKIEIKFQNPKNTKYKFITDIKKFNLNRLYHVIKIHNHD